MPEKGIFKFLFAQDPQQMLADVSPDSVLDPQPPSSSNYRPADIQGVSCDTCVRFGFTNADQNGVSKGICGLWEAWVAGDHVCDRYQEDTPPWDAMGNQDWSAFDFSETNLSEIHFTGDDALEVVEKDGLVKKEILRTGEWPVIPSSKGILNRPLTITRSGLSDPDKGIISLEELKENFDKKVISKVQVPLSNEENDHKNITEVNTGFVKELWIEDDENDENLSHLMAGIDFTEPDVKEKALRGTYSDVSSGIPFGVRKKGENYGAVLEHVCITNRPFIEDLGPFMMAASDEISKQLEDKEVNHFVLTWKPADEKKEEEKKEDKKEESKDETVKTSPIVLSYQDQVNGLNSQLSLYQLNPNSYKVTDIKGNTAFINHATSGNTWEATFTTTSSNSNPITLVPVSDWKMQTSEEAPAKKSDSASSDPLEEARHMRELRLSQPTVPQTTEGGSMSGNGNGNLSGIELSELPEDARARVQQFLNENADLRAENREEKANKRIEELKELGLAERPGALTFYRQLYLSDDGGPAVVLLSQDSKNKERLTALEVIDRFIEAIKGSDDKVVLSDQALVSGNDNKPPDDAAGEQKPVEERLAEAKEAIYGKKANK